MVSHDDFHNHWYNFSTIPGVFVFIWTARAGCNFLKLKQKIFIIYLAWFVKPLSWRDISVGKFEESRTVSLNGKGYLEAFWSIENKKNIYV